MKKNLIILLISLAGASPLIGVAQSKTTEALNKKHSDALTAFFYNNTLRMLNQTDDKDFDALIKDVEKMKFLMIDKGTKFKSADYKKLVSEYKAESFEEIMTSRYEGKNFDIYLKEKDNVTKGMIVLVNDSASLYVLDIVGRIAINKVTQFYKKIGESADIGSRIKAFAKKDDDDND